MTTSFPKAQITSASKLYTIWISNDKSEEKLNFRQKNEPHLFYLLTSCLFVAIIFACYENNFEGDNKLLNKKKERKGYLVSGGDIHVLTKNLSRGKNKSLCGFHTNSY